MSNSPVQPSPPFGAASCSSFVRMFQPRFAALVERGEKTQTVRPWPKRMPKTGDSISCRAWTGKPYRSKQRILCEATIDGVWTIELDRDEMRIDSVPSSRLRMESFATADGFISWQALCDWFEKAHGLPFFGIVIRWTNAPHERPPTQTL